MSSSSLSDSLDADGPHLPELLEVKGNYPPDSAQVIVQFVASAFDCSSEIAVLLLRAADFDRFEVVGHQ